MKTGSYVLNSTKNKKERVGRLLQMHANKRQELDEVFSGDIAAAVGFKTTSTGDTICDEQHPIILESMEFPEPVISVAIEPKTKVSQGKMSDALAKLAEVDLEVYGLALLKAGTNLDNQSPASILEMDAKSFPMGDKKVRVGQVNIVDEKDVLQYKAELMALMEEKSKEENFELFLLLITNILTSDSTGLVVGNVLPVEEAFKGKVENNLINLEGVVSRKKQVIPQLTRAIEG